MSFIHNDLGYRERGEIVQVRLSGSAANVCLLDTTNFNAYKRGGKFHYYGGLAKQSPINITIPHSGHWHVTVDMRGLRGKVNASVRILPSPLPEIRQTPLATIPSLLHDKEPDIHSKEEYEIKIFDVFISHATEDKESIVRPLANYLKEKGLKVWYDEFELKIGDSLRRKIDLGISRSLFGIVVLSKSFFSKNWTNYELDGLVTKSITGEQILLPIWHDITKNELISYSPSLADKVARSTGTSTIEEIGSEICELILEHKIK